MGMRTFTPTEDQEQSLYFQWLGYVSIAAVQVTTTMTPGEGDGAEQLRPHCYAIPNGGSRHRAVAAKLQAQGVTPGVCDVNIDIPSGVFHGCRIEFKRQKGGRLSDEQRSHISHRLRMGYHAVICSGFAQARVATVEYLSKSWRVIDRWRE
jgi:hypothetical protein